MLCYLKNTLKSRFRCTIDNTALYKHNSRKTVGSSIYKSSKKPFKLRNYSKFDVYREKDIYIYKENDVQKNYERSKQPRKVYMEGMERLKSQKSL